MAIKIKLKNSVTQDAVPTGTHLPEVGELAVNANINSIGGYMRASDNSIVKIFGPGSVSTPAASTTVSGIAELATSAETTTGTDTARVCTPAGVKAVTDAERTTSNSTYLAKAGGTLTGVLVATAGSNSAPAIHFGDSDSGIYGGTNTVSLAAGGTQGLSLDSSAEVEIPTKLAINGAGKLSPLNVRGMTDGNLHIRAITDIHSGTGIGIDVLNDANNTIKDLAIRAANTVFKNASSESARIDSGGRLLVGHSNSRAVSGATPRIVQVESTDAATGIAITRNTNSTNAPYISFGKTRGGSVGGTTIVQDNDALGVIQFAGADGTDVQSVGAEIKSLVDGTVAGDRMPGSLLFRTTADSAGSVAPTTALTLNSSQNALFAGKVGIGNNSPESQYYQDLVVGDGTNNRGITIHSCATCTGNLAFSDSTSGTGRYDGRIMYDHSTNNRHLKFFTATNRALTLDHQIAGFAGKVGVGTEAPTELLEVYSAGASAAIEISAGAASTTTGEAKLVLRSLHSSSGTSYSRSEIASLAVAGGDSDLIFRTTTQIAGPEERMRIDSEGLVGIGTNPGTLFHIKEPTTSGAKDILHVESHGGGHFLIKCNDTAAANPGWQLRTYASEDIQIAPGNTVALTLDSSDQSATFAGQLKVKGGGTSTRFETYANGVIIYGPEGGAGILGLYADEGDDNADKWRLSASSNGTLYLQNYSTASWVTGLSLDGSNNANFAGHLSVNTGATNVVADFISTDDNAWIQFKDDGTTDTAVMIGAKDNDLLLRSGSNVALTLDSSQNATFAGSELNLVNTANAGDARLKLQAGETGTAYILLKADDGDNQSDNYRIIVPNGGPLSIQYDGGLWESSIECDQNGAVKLFFDSGAYSTPKIQTLSVGASITGSLGINTSSPTTFNANADELVLHNASGTCGMTISSPNDSIGRIAFADPQDNNIGEIRYAHGGAYPDSLQFVVNAAERLRIESDGEATFAGKIAINTVARIESTGEYKAPHGTAASPAYNFLNDNDNGMYRVTTNTLGFSTGGVHRLSITSDGFVQVGASADAAEAPLHVTSENSQGINAIFGAKDFIVDDQYNYDDANIALQGRDASSNETGAGIQFTVRNTGNSNWLHGAFVLNRDGNYILYRGTGNTDGTEKLRITPNGELRVVGTGDNNDPPHLRLHHPDTSIVTGDRIGEIRFAGQDSGGATESRTGALIRASAAANWDTGQASGYAATNLEFFTQDNIGTDGIAAGPRLRVTSNGKVLIGTTSTNGIHSQSGAVGLSVKSGAVGSNYGEGVISLMGSGGDFYAMTMRQSTGNGWGLLPIFSSTIDRLQFGYYDAESSPAVNKGIFTIYEDGNARIDDGNLIVANGHGINFSASEGGTGTSNESSILDDYEEGDFTPTVEFGSGGTLNMSLGTALGRYTKIGRVIRCEFTINFSAKGDSTGGIYIASLPFASQDNSRNRMVGIVPYFTNVNSINGHTMAYGGTPATRVPLYDATNGSTIINQGNINDNTLIRGVVTYNCN